VELKKQVKGYNKSQNELNQVTKKIKSYQYKLAVAKGTCDTVTNECELVVEDLKKKVESVNQTVLDSENDCICLLERLYELEHHTFETT